MTFNVKFFNRTLAHELGHGAFTWQHPFDEPFKNEQGATRNLMDYVTDDDLAYFQWQSTLGLNLTWGFLEGDEDAMGLLNWYHWIPVDKDEFWDDDLKDLVNDYEDEMEFIIKNRSTWVNLSEKKNLEEYPKWTVVKDGKISEKWLSVKENETTTLKDYKANHIYAYANTVITETKKEKTYSGDESPARFTYFFIYVFKDAPKLTNYRIKDFSELENNQRVRAFYYGNKYGAIAFFSESGELQAIMQFDYSESNATSEMKKSMTEDWVTSLLGGGNVDKNETPTQALGHYIVTDENALVRDKDDRSKSTGVKIPYGTEVIIDTSKGEEKIKSSIIVYVKLADSGDEYYTSKSNLTEIVIVNNEVKKLPYSVKSLKLPYAIESTGITHTKDLECTIIAKCGDYYGITSPELKEFGTSENSKGYWCYDWKTKNRLTPFEISLVRPEIEKITNVKDRGDDFQKLQEKVPYHNQRDNNNTTKISDGMCNLTSIAMAYEVLGIGRDSVVKIVESKNDISLPDSIKNGQFEDLLEHLRKEKNYGGRTAYKTWDDIADYLDIKYKTYWISSSQKNNAKINELNDSLRHGCGVIVSLFNWKGHIVRMQAIGENGMTIDDPFGKLKRMTIRDIDCNISSGSYNGNDRNLSDNGKKGEDNILTWEEFDVKNFSTGGKDGAEVEIEGKTILTDQSTVTNQVTFETWWNSSSRVGKSEYLTRTTSETKNGKTINKTYYKTKGAVIKIYKVYYK